MTSIRRATENDVNLLSEISTCTFIESHGSSAKPEDIYSYVRLNYNPGALRIELQDPNNLYHLIFYKDEVAGFSKIIVNCPYKNCDIPHLTKLDRFYLLKKFYGLRLGQILFEFLLSTAKGNCQDGMWLFVWKENHRAVNFYTKNGFVVIGSYDFRISEDHTNPNYQMLLTFK